MTKPATCLAVIVLLSLCGFAASQTSNPGSPLRAFELYSWQDAKGVWYFNLMPNTSSEKSVDQVIDRKRALVGLNNLKTKLSALPKGSEVFWLDRIPSGSGPKAKGSEGLKYPPVVIIEEIRQYCALREIKVEILH